jgi:hypothetical protein
MAILSPNSVFSHPESEERIAKNMQALAANGISTMVVENGDEARQRVLDVLPEGAEVFTTGSRTLDAIGLTSEINESSRFQAVRPRLMTMTLDRQKYEREIRRLGAIPEIVIGSVHAVTEQGQVLIASASGSQLASYVFGAGRVIWVVGTQKLVSDLEEGMCRIEEYSYRLEDARVREMYGRASFIGKILIVQREYIPGRTTIVLVKENLGF